MASLHGAGPRPLAYRVYRVPGQWPPGAFAGFWPAAAALSL